LSSILRNIIDINVKAADTCVSFKLLAPRRAPATERLEVGEIGYAVVMSIPYWQFTSILVCGGPKNIQPAIVATIDAACDATS